MRHPESRIAANLPSKAMIITPIQVRFNDMDPMRRVNNSTYGSYLELGRLDFCQRYLKIEELEDIPFVLVRVEMDLRASLRPGTEVNVKTWVSAIGTSSWEFSAHILGASDGKIYVEAKTVQVYFDYRKDCTRPIPDEFRAFLEKEMN